MIKVRSKKHLVELIKSEIAEHGTSVDLNHLDVRSVKDMRYVFDGTGFQGNVSKWNTKNVTNMALMFNNCTDFNCDLSSWNVGKVTSMGFMFSDCKNFNGNLSSWDVGKVKDMDGMFLRCSSFNGNLSKWNVGNVRTMVTMFEGCSSFNQNLTKWNVENVKFDRNMFEDTRFGGTDWEGYVEFWKKYEDGRKLGLFGKFFK